MSFAKIQKEKAEELNQKYSSLETTSVKDRQEKISSLLDAQKAKLAQAREAGDTNAEVEISKQIAQLGYEEARIQQKNPTSTVNVLDKARPPQRKSRPKRKLIVLVAGAASLFFSIVSIVTIEFFNRLTEINPENREKVRRLARFLRINS